MAMLKRLGVLGLLLLLLIPTAVFPSGDGDIPELPPEKYFEPDLPHGIPGDEVVLGKGTAEASTELDFRTLWRLIIRSLSLLP